MQIRAEVESPGRNIFRKGRGFSTDELAAVKFTVKEARKAGLIVDLRRKSKYSENIASLKVFKEDYAKLLAEKEKLRLKAIKDNKKARKEALKRKADDDVLQEKRLKDIEEERKQVQEEIAKREAEELEAETAEELSTEELAELDDLEGEALATDSVESPEEALEKLEDDLSDSLGEKATPAEAVAAPDGAKRVVKRVRKKPSTTTKGVTDKAEKKE